MLISLIASAITFDRTTKRKRSDYCKRYKSDYFSTTSGYFWASPDPNNECEPPKYNKSQDDDWGIKTYNFIRWATGFTNTITINDTYHRSQCECALYNYYYGNLTHNPVKTGKCYSKGADEGCGSSNLAWGYAHTASAIAGYYWDVYTPSLGHRYWILSASMKETSFCGVGAYSALKTFEMESEHEFAEIGSKEIPFRAVPHPGPIDTSLLVRDWSFDAPNLCKNPKIVTRQNGTVVPHLNERFSTYYYIWSPNITREFNTTYTVDIDCGSISWSYESFSTNCSIDVSDLEFDKQMGRKSLGVYWQYAINYFIIAIFIAAVLSIAISIYVVKKGLSEPKQQQTDKKTTLKKFLV